MRRLGLRSYGLCMLLALVLPGRVVAGAAVLSPLKDNTLFGDPSGELSSGAGPSMFCGNNSVANTRRAVIAFDVASHVPAQATVDSVELQLFVSSAPNDVEQQFTLHRLYFDWGEGTSVSAGGAGAPSTTNDATWLHTYYPDQFWPSAGGDFDPVASAETTVGTGGHHVWSSAAMTADVQHWLDTPAEDFGWLIKGDESIASTVRRFDTRENETVENRPLLIIYYTLNPAPTSQVPWGQLKQRYNQPGGSRQ